MDLVNYIVRGLRVQRIRTDESIKLSYMLFELCLCSALLHELLPEIWKMYMQVTVTVRPWL